MTVAERVEPTYRAYGLTVRVNREVPGLVLAPEAGPGDLRVEFVAPAGEVDPCPVGTTLDAFEGQTDRGPSMFQVCRLTADQGGGLSLRWSLGELYVQFVIDAAVRRIVGTWAPGVAFEDTLQPLLGPVLGCVLRLRGAVCLHASVIGACVGDAGAENGPPTAAIAIVGAKFGGKSTLAAALAHRGHALLSDDLAVLREDRGTFWVQPGLPRLLLWPSSAAVIPDMSTDDLPRIWVTPDVDKRQLILTAEPGPTPLRFHPSPLPLRAIYALGPPDPPDTHPRVSPIAKVDALVTVMSNTYADYVLDRSGRVRDFEVLGRLAGHVPVRQVHRPWSLDAIPQTCTAILDDLAQVCLE